MIKILHQKEAFIPWHTTNSDKVHLYQIVLMFNSKYQVKESKQSTVGQGMLSKQILRDLSLVKKITRFPT